MGTFQGAMLIADIDGTLLHDGIIPKNNIEAIKEFIGEGGLFTVATGRGVPAIHEVYKEALCNAPVITLQGGMIYDMENKKVLFSKPLENSNKLFVKEVLKKNKDVGIQVYIDSKVYCLQSNNGFLFHVNYEKMQYTTVNYKEIEKSDWCKVVFLCDKPSDVASLFSIYNSKNPINSKFLCTMRYGDIQAVELFPSDVHKGVAVEYLKNKYNREIFSIGDMFIDNELIAASKHGAATLGAPDDVKKYAEYITCDVRDGAVADYIGYIKSILRGSKLWISKQKNNWK